MTGISGLSFLVRDPPASRPAPAGLSGLSFGVISRVLSVSLYRLLHDAYVPLATYPVTLILSNGVSKVSGLTDGRGVATFEFSDLDVTLNLDAASVPAGHTAGLTYPLRVGPKTEVVVTFIPDLPVRSYPLAQVF